MYLEGRKTLKYDSKAKKVEMDGFVVDYIGLSLGYWRKHPDLHGFIVREFADGVDDCREIYIGDEAGLSKILVASEADGLPNTEGFFFGESMAEDKDNTRKILEMAIAWVAEDDPRFYRGVYYRASW